MSEKPGEPTNDVKVAAVYASASDAHEAVRKLDEAGVPPSQVTVLDKPPQGTTSAAAPKGVWQRLRALLLHEETAHHYAEAVERGHTVVVANVPQENHEGAIAALAETDPVDLDEQVEDWRSSGWSGEYGGASQGITASGVLAGDYGAVGAPIGGSAPDTDITRHGLIRSYRIR